VADDPPHQRRLYIGLAVAVLVVVGSLAMALAMH
jgi:hypothetical protein